MLLKKLAGKVLRLAFGPRYTWCYRSQAEKEFADISARINDAFKWVPESTHVYGDQPVFIFSAGWRSGSTLLQRMIMQQNEDIVIWGEPFHRANILDGMAAQFRCFTPSYPQDRFFLSSRGSCGLSDQWVANLYPDVEDLVKAHRKFFEVLFADPARKTGATYWGLKAVRLTVDHAIYLRKIFPDCKIIFLCRNPLDCYASFWKINSAFFLKWPNRVVATPYAFGKHWAHLAGAFLQRHSEVGGVVVRYEDLDDTAQVERLEQYLGRRVSRASAVVRIGGDQSVGGRAGGNRINLPYIDRMLLNLSTGGTRKNAGY